jgi:hypothetical protein
MLASCCVTIAMLDRQLLLCIPCRRARGRQKWQAGEAPRLDVAWRVAGRELMRIKASALEAHGCKLLLGATGRAGGSKGPGLGSFMELHDQEGDVTMSDMSVDM